MAARDIVKAPSPTLRRKARRVTIVDASIRKLVDDMFESMYAAKGGGLAAPQIGVSLRVVVFAPPEQETLVLINPEIVKREGERLVSEGCLSIPGVRALMKRAVMVKAKGLDLDGRQVRVKAEGYLAQAIEHELDHLDGVLMTDKMERELQPEEEPEPAEALAS